MKTFIRSGATNGLSLFLLGQVISGVVISGGLRTYVLGGIFLTILGVTLKPVFNIISLPLNMATLGVFSFITNAILLYILTVLVTGIKIEPFVFKGFSWAGFILPQIGFNTLLSYIVSATVLSLIQAVIKWLIDR